jgi:hypothetical protein
VFKKLYDSSLKNWLLIFEAIIFIAFQIDNSPRTDDDYLGEQVYWLAKIGKVKSDFGGSVVNYNTYQSIYHKLFIYVGYVFDKLFGWSLLSLHAVSMCSFLIFIFVFYKYSKIHLSNENKFRFWAVMLLLLFNQDLLYAVGDFRPEVMIMTLGFGSFILLERFLSKRKTLDLIAAAILAGLCMFAHLNGLIFIAAGTFLLIYKGAYKQSVLFVVIAVIAFLPYFTDVWLNADFNYFKTQFLQDNVVTGVHRNWYTPFIKLVDEQARFFYTGKQIPFTLLLLFTLIFSFKKLKEQHKNLLIYTLVLVFAMAVTNPSKTSKYLVLYLPFLCLIIANGWIYIRNQKKSSVPFHVLLAGTIIVSIIYSTLQIKENIKNLNTGGIVAENKKILAKIPEHFKTLHLLAPRNMVFYNLGKVRELQDIEGICDKDIIDLLHHSDINYIVFSKRDQKCFDLPALLKNENQLLQITDSTEEYKLVKVKRN